MSRPATRDGSARDDVELQLLGLWRALLRDDDLGVHDDFFEMGGHSLLAMRLVVQIQRTFDADVAPSALLEAATVAEMAQLIRGGRAGGSRRPLVHLQPGTPEAAPLYVFPPVSGTLLLYGRFVQGLGRDVPVWGLQSPGLLPGEEPLHTVEAIAARFVAAMSEVHEGGPWNLLGYSMGGILAFEAARQLAAAGGEVGLVGLLDTRPTVDPLEDDLDFALRALLFRALKVDLDVDWLRGLEPDERARVLLERSVEAGTIPPDFDPERLRLMVDMYHHNLIALTSYELSPYGGDVVVFRVTDRHLEDDDPLPDDLGWSAHARSAAVVDVPGDHFTMIDPGNVETLAARVREHLR